MPTTPHDLKLSSYLLRCQREHRLTGWQLLKTPRFFYFFWTQFLGAFNDNIFRNALALYITFRLGGIGALGPDALVSVCGAIFIVPFLIFSAIAGQAADKWSKTTLVRYVKLAEIVIMGLGAIGFLLPNLPLLLAMLFLMGAQSAFFGPVKYSILPELVSEESLLYANAFTEMGTVLAILFGLVLGNILAEIGAWPLAFGVMIVATLGWLTSLRLPPLTAHQPQLDFSWKVLRSTSEIFAELKRSKSLLKTIYAISWFWAIGIAMLSLFPGYSKVTLKGGPECFTYLMVLFCVGVSLGSLLCPKLAKTKWGSKLSLLGAFAFTISLLDLWLLGIWQHSPGPLPLSEIVLTHQGLRMSLDLLLFSLGGGLYIVPLYTKLQLDTEPQFRSRAIAANNIANAIAMVIASLGLTILFLRNFSHPQIFLILSGLNLLCTVLFLSRVTRISH